MMSKNLLKKIAIIFFTLLISISSIFADDMETTSPNNDNDDDIEFNFNVSGDQFIKIGIMVTKPLNFDGTMKLGGAGEIGYFRFLTSNIALGFDVEFGYNPTIGGNVYTYIPILLSILYQPTIGNFEFPLTVSGGASMENYLNRSFFPGWTLKTSLGAFYRVSNMWSFGVEGKFMYMPQFYNNSEYNDFGTFASVEFVARYHF